RVPGPAERHGSLPSSPLSGVAGSAAQPDGAGFGPDAKRGVAAEVFVLDMGEPVRIMDLARATIELSGLDPDRDIEIEIVGRRAGEKLHEELVNGYEQLRPTSAEKILLAEHEPLAGGDVERMFAEIGLLVLEGDAAGLAAKVSELSAMRPGSAVVAPVDDSPSAAGSRGAAVASDATAPGTLERRPGALVEAQGSERAEHATGRSGTHS